MNRTPTLDTSRPAATALNWNGLTIDQWNVLNVSGWDNLLVDHVPTGGAGMLEYSPTGNRLTQTDPVTGNVTTFTYDYANRLLTAVDVSGTTTYTYDANGNQETIEEPSGDITTNTWNGENRLVRIEHPDGTETNYRYNGDGLRVAEDHDGTVTLFVYDGNNRLQETDDVGTVEAEYTYLPLPYAEVLSQRRDMESSFYLCDGIRNIRQLTDGSQSITDEYSFDAWGILRSSTGSTANSQLYKGRLLSYRNDPHAGPDTQTSTHFRNQSAQTGRFTSEDPAADDHNLYRPVGNNPVNGEDPSGLEEETNTSYDYLVMKQNASYIALYYVNVGYVWNSSPEYIGDIDPETGFVRSPWLYVVDGSLPGTKVLKHRWTTMASIQRKTDEWDTQDWKEWWDAGREGDNGIYDKHPDEMVNSDGGLTAYVSNLYRAAGGRLTPEEAESIRTGIEGTKMMAQAAMEFYATAPLEVAGQMRTMSQMRSLKRTEGVVDLARTADHTIDALDRGIEAQRMKRTAAGLEAAKDLATYPGARSLVDSEKLSQFKRTIKNLGYEYAENNTLLGEAGEIIGGKVDVKNKIVTINRKVASQATLIDEYAHIWNDVTGHGRFLSGGQQALHKNLAAEAYLKGTKELGVIRDTIFHQLELKNLVNSGWSLPEFFKGVSVDDIRRFAD
ncbi:MAG: hypothetical protein JNL58_31510 [Planctomyces sp.]|nr:hypothetical protein [Planctomyces sp.]